MVGLFGANLPQRESRAVEARRIAERRLEERRLRHGAFCQQPFDVVLERVERRMWRGSNRGPRPAGADAAGQLIPDAAAEPREDGEELRELAPLGDLRLQASGVQANAPRRDRQRGAVDSIGSHHHIGGADQLPHLDDGRAAERTGHRQVQLLERAHALRSDDRAWPARAQAVGQQHRRRLAQPVKTRLVAGVLERDDQHAWQRRHRADARGCRRLRRNTRRGAAHDQSQPAAFW